VAENDIGYYTLPVILSFEGVEKQVTSKLSRAFGDVGKKSGKALADGTEAEVKRASDAYGKLRNKAEDALGKVRVEEEKLAAARAKGNNAQTVAAEERLNKARRDSAAATRAASESFKDYEAAQKRLGDGTKGLGLNFDGLSGMAGKAGQAMTAAGVVAAGAALAGLAALGAGVLVLGRELYDLGKSWDDTMDGIAIKTGIIGPELDKLKQNVKDLAPNTAASIDAIGGVVGSVKQSLHLTGIELDVMAKNIVDLDRMTGQQTNVRELGKAFRGFGVDVKDQVGALNELMNVSQATGIPVNDLIKTMVDGGAKVRGFGMSFSETAAFIAAFEEAGVNGEKVINGLGKAAINLSKDGKGGAAGLREALTEIQNLINSGQNDLARAKASTLFGAKAYAEIFDVMARGAIDIQNLDSALAGGGPTIAELAAATDDWEQTWQKLKNTISVALEPVASGVFNLINEQLTGLSDWVTQNQDKVIGIFKQIADWAFNSAKAVVAFVADSLRAIGSFIEKVQPIIRGAGDALDWIPGMDNAAEGLKSFGDSMNSWPDALNGVADKIEGTFNPALQKGQDYVGAFMSRTQEAAKFTQLLGDTIASADGGVITLSDNTPEVRERLDAIGLEIVNLPDGTFGVNAKTDEAQKVLDAYIAQATGEPIELTTTADTSGADADIKKWAEQLAIDIPMGAGAGLGAGTLLGLDPAMYGGTPGAPGATGSEKGLTSNSVSAKRAVEQNFPAIKQIGGWRPPDGYNEHFSGQALDIMIPDYGSASGKQYGDSVAKYLLDNASQFGIDYVLWQQRQWNADGTSKPMSDRGDPTQNHMDHVHAHTVRTPNLPGASTPTSSPAATTTLVGATPVPAVPSGAAGTAPALPAASSSIDSSRLYQSGPMGPATRTPGTDQWGETGYYETDPKRIRDAQQKADDAQEAIRAADAAAAQARARREELPIDAEQSAILGADEAVRAAEERAAKARREAADAATDLAEAAKGDFKKAKDEKKSGRGNSDVAGVGGIFGSFLKETLGIGDWLPSLDNLMPLQMADSLIGFGVGMSGQDGAGTSTGPFGIPDVAAPPMPDGAQHAGMGGAPGPATVVNVDNSQNFQNSPLGWDPAQVEKQRNNNINRAPRLPVGMGS
jgi:hypothetical protein